MQRAIFQQTSITEIQSQATRMISGQAINDDVYHDETSSLKMVLSVLANVVGGALLLSGMLMLPHVIAGFMG